MPAQSDLGSLKDLVRPRLREYLLGKGIRVNTRDMFQCIRPEHHDQDPSCHFIPASNGEAAYCFGCNTAIDIFLAHHILDDAPMSGMDFVRKNLYVLLDKFGIKYQKIEFSREDLLKSQVQDIYSLAASLLIEKNQENALVIANRDFAKQRGWTDATCDMLNIGTVQNYKKFVRLLETRTGVPAVALDSTFGISRNLFGPELITFAIRDHTGRVQGFVARNVHYIKGCGKPKYYNTNEVHNPGYKKREILYGLYIAKNYPGHRLDIFEGYPDLVTAQQAGIRCCCALGGLAFTEEHVDLIKRLGFVSVNLILDQDAPGKQEMKKYIEMFGYTPGLSLSVTNLPIPAEDRTKDGQDDVDFFVRKYGIKAYQTIEPIDAFTYQITTHQEDIDAGRIDKILFAEQMIPIVLNAPNIIRRSEMIKALAKVAKLPEEDLRKEIEAIDLAKLEEIKQIHISKIKRAKHPDDIRDALVVADLALQDTSIAKEERQYLSVEESLENYESVLHQLDTRETGIHGWVTGLGLLDDVLDGLPIPAPEGRLVGFAGPPHHNKSALLFTIALGVARNPKNACSTLFWALDDPRTAIYPRLLSIMTDVPVERINKLKPEQPGDKKKLLVARDELHALIQSGRLLIKDDKIGRNKSTGSKWILDMQQRFGRPVLFMIDSFHNVSVGGEKGISADERVKTKEISSWLKSSTKRDGFTVVCTMETSKASGTGKPQILNILESSKMSYDFDAIGIVFSEFLASGRKHGEFYWVKNSQVMPVVSVDIQKNKLTGKQQELILLQDKQTTGVREPSELYPIKKDTEGILEKLDQITGEEDDAGF